MAHWGKPGGGAGGIKSYSEEYQSRENEILRARRLQCFVRRKRVYKMKELGHEVGPVRIDYWTWCTSQAAR